MSYILDALKKAERQRQAGAVPRLSTIHAPAPPRRRRVGRLVLAAALLANAALVVVILRQGPSEPPAPLPVVESDQPGAAGSGELARETPPPPVAPPAVEPARDRPSPSAPRREPAATPRPAVPALAAPALTAPALIAPERPPVPPATPAPEKPEPTAPAATKPEPPRSAVSPPRDAPSAPPPAAPVASPSRSEIPASFRQAVSAMRLEVLVYSDDPTGRQVFINGRRYAQGERIDENIVVEEIVSEGVVLSWAGHRHLLRHLR